MKPQAGPVMTSSDAASGSAMSGRWATVLVLLALLVIGLAAVAGYTGVASEVISTGDARSSAPSDSTATAAVAPRPEAAPPDQGPDAKDRSLGSSGPPPVGTGPTATATSKPGELRWPLWEFQLRQPIPPREPPLTPLPWRLVGSATSGPVKQLIILREGKTAPEFYVKGDSLPGGYVVGEITDEDVTLIHGKRALLLSFIGIR